MKLRIAMWAVVGVLIAGFWAIYFFPSTPTPIASAEPMWTFARITCPIAFASFYFHFPVSVYWVLLTNATTYALVGLSMETLRQRLIHAK
jgi:hypothetical protein